MATGDREDGRAHVPSVYGSPALQAACGIDTGNEERNLRKAATSPLHRQVVETRIAELRSHIDKGGLREAVVRAALYVGMARQYVDERRFELIRKIRLVSTDHQKLTLSQFKAMVREQFFMLLIDQEAALAAIPALLPPSAEERQALGRDPGRDLGERRACGRGRRQIETRHQAVRWRKTTHCVRCEFLKASP